ncbi:MAG TPA: hypothetical protein VKX17_21415 [Planctomycetota bacterium]|nr:hypothetical protein [Planctomycetota bacterium]
MHDKGAIMTLSRYMTFVAIVVISCRAAALDKEDSRRVALEIVSKSSDANLEEFFKAASWIDRQTTALALRFKEARVDDSHEHSDIALTDIIRRGGADWEKRLAVLADLALQNTDSAVTSVLLLAALRRIQKKPDPMQIELTLPPGGPESEFPALPPVEATLVNRDLEKAAFTYTDGGNYRSGRLARWRFQIKRSDGSFVPVKKRWGTGGGIYNVGTMQPNESWKTTLDMNSFMSPLEPGDYEVTVQYHDSSTIDNNDDLTGLIVFSSTPFKLRVKPRTLAVSATDLKRASDLLRAIPEDAPLKIVAGTYAENFHGFVSPDSPHGKLLQMGLSAVPPLLDELESKGLSTSRRAWIFSLLFSLTSCNDPRYEQSGKQLLGSYEDQEGTWQIVGGKGVMGFGAGGHGTSFGGPGPSETDQHAFTERWMKWKSYLKVVEPKPETRPEF